MQAKNLEQLKQVVDSTLSAGFYIAYIDDLREAEKKGLLGDLQREALASKGFTTKMLEEENKVYFIFDIASSKCDTNTLKLRKYIVDSREEKLKSIERAGIKLTLPLHDAEALINALDYLLRAGDLISKKDKGSLSYIKMTTEQQAKRVKAILEAYNNL